MIKTSTYAGGRFDLPDKIAKIVRVGENSEGERKAANNALEKYGYFLDRVGIVWELGNIPDFAKDKAENTIDE